MNSVLSIKATILKSIQLYRQTFFILMPFMIILMGFIIFNKECWLKLLLNHNQMIEEFTSFSFQEFSLYFVYFAIFVYIINNINLLIYRKYKNYPLNYGEALKISAKCFISLIKALCITLGFMIIFITILVAIGAIFLALGVDLIDSLQPFSKGIPALEGIIFSVFLQIVYFLIVCENLPSWTAFKKAAVILNGHWLRTIALTLLVSCWGFFFLALYALLSKLGVDSNIIFTLSMIHTFFSTAIFPCFITVHTENLLHIEKISQNIVSKKGIGVYTQNTSF